jgi:endonuclease-8
VLSTLGPDLLDREFDMADAVRRLKDPSRADTEIGEALLDQRAVAGIGNVFKSEILFIERVSPFAPLRTLDEATLERILTTARDLLQANARPDAPAGRTTTIDPRTGAKLAPSRLWVYDRAGRPCHRDGTLIKSTQQGAQVPRSTYWCPTCQASDAAATADRPAGKRPTRAARG